ncbi:response regulator [Cytophaga aurantiaca]|uniref:response regulator n=1 Tax=Cytophaga aurantiaca TaxID=29530 RepID=UPI00036A71DD|nr:response regulator [Cytophaga aurantiaca]
MTDSKLFKVFVLEDDINNRKTIANELRSKNYALHFFSKDNSVFDLLTFNPDIIIHDYFANKITHCHEWDMAY